MYLAILGYLLIIIMMWALLKSKLTPVVAFCVLPPIFGILAGFNVVEISDFVGKGVSGTLSAAALCLFATTYFGIMNENGLFDPMVSVLSRKAGGNIVMIMIITSIISSVSHMDTGVTSTILVTVPAMLPLFKKFRIRLEYLFLLIAQSVAVINLFPHGGGMVRVSSVTGLDVGLMFSTLFPVILACIGFNLASAVFYGMKEKKRISTLAPEMNSEDATMGEESGKKLGFRYYANLVLTLMLLTLMFLNIVKSYFVFMVGLALALVINYSNTKDQNGALKRLAGNAYPVGITMLASGVLVGVMGESGMLTEMANVIVMMIPESLKHFYTLIVGFVSLPLSVALGADGFYYGLTPLFTQVGATYGISTLSIVSIMMLARDAFGLITPVSAVTYLAPGMLGMELKDLIKFAIKYLFILFCFEVLMCIVLGIIPLYS